MFFKVALTVVLLSAGLSIAQPPPLDTGILSQAIPLGECYVCKTYIESFKKGLERTAKGNYEGGDAAWEEEKLKTYTRSEMRLVDIQEGLCKEVSKNAVQCHHMAEKAEEYIEEWWAQNPDESADLYTYICVEKMKVCCPKYHFGKYCTPCRGNPEMPCSGKGRCRGEGTRKGNGTCVCDDGYTGDLCDQCAPDYFLSHKHGSNIICSPCHQSCLGGCREATQKDCVACKPGFAFDADEGCTDINECDDVNTCKKNEFCLNSLGSFMCMKCDKSCESCYGDGPDMCRKCASGYSKKGEFCIADREEEEDSSQKLTTTRKEEL